MRVLLYQTELNPGVLHGVFHFGTMALGAFLREKGHEVHVRTVQRSVPPDSPELVFPVERQKFLVELRDVDPGLVGFSVMTDEWYYVSRLAAWIKEEFEVPIICGGAHPTVAPEEVISDPNVDMLCRGEGEHALAELCESLDRDSDNRTIKNLWVKDADHVCQNPLRPLIDDLNELPFPAIDLVDYQRLLAGHGSTIRFMIGRGCPFNCTYCINDELHRLYRGNGKAVRKWSPERVVKELKRILSMYHSVKAIGFDDDILCIDKGWFERFCSLYKREIGLPFGFFMRVEMVETEFLRLAREAGGNTVMIGVETGNEWLRREVLNRKMNNEQIIDAFRLLDEYGLGSISLNMIGLPFETREMIEETIDLNRRLKPTRVVACPFQPYPGTKLRQVSIEQGFLSEGKLFVDRRTSLLELPGLSRGEIECQVLSLQRTGYQIAAKKHPVGIYDFISRFADAEINDLSGKVDVNIFDLEQRLILETSPPANVSYRLQIPRDSCLCFEIGMHQHTYEQEGDGVFFAIEVTTGRKGDQPDLIFERYLNPKRNLAERGWMSCRVPLNNLGGEDVILSFITKPGPSLDEGSRIAGWRRPYIDTFSGVEPGGKDA